MTTIPTKGREFEIAAQVAELLDELPPQQQLQVMALLAARYGVTFKEPRSTKPRRYSPQPKRH